MVSERHLLHFSCVLAIFFGCLTNAQEQPIFLAHYCNFNATVSNYTSNSIFQTNLDNITSTLFASSARFYNFSIGQNPDRVYVIALCRGDVDMETCRSCLTEANTKLRNLCPNQKQSIGWDDYCMLRYWDQPIFNTMQTLPNAYVYNPETVPNSSQFNQALLIWLNNLLFKASKGTSVQKFSTGSLTIDNGMTIYALVECTPDLSEQDCRDCLNRTTVVLPECCDFKMGGRVLYPSCYFRYELGQFYNESMNDGGPPITGTTLPQPPDDGRPPTTDATLPQPLVTGKDDNKTRTVIIILIPSMICVIFVIACIFIFVRKQEPIDESEIANEFSTVESLQYDFDIIRAKTNEFSETNKLGQGGFGVVYKGRLRDGRDIAVKRLSKCSDQGELEFKNEVLLMANLQHRNLVRLIGFCLQGIERLLIYEFIPNASLDHFIFDQQKRGHLDGNMRYKIIGGIARGLLYLHEDSRVRIIHRDLKPSNILLDATMNPKIADFGMARIFDLDENEKQASTKRIVGTYGYMAPEYAMFGQFSVKSDVYSFGVLVLEIISGKKNNHGIGNEENLEYLLSYAWKNWKEGTYSKFIDPTLKDGSFSINEIMRCIHIGLLCVQENVVDRPTMASVVNMFNNLSLPLQIPTEPAFFKIDPQRSQVNFKSKDSVNEASITKLSGR